MREEQEEDDDEEGVSAMVSFDFDAMMTQEQTDDGHGEGLACVPFGGSPLRRSAASSAGSPSKSGSMATRMTSGIAPEIAPGMVPGVDAGMAAAALPDVSVVSSARSSLMSNLRMSSLTSNLGMMTKFGTAFNNFGMMSNLTPASQIFPLRTMLSNAPALTEQAARSVQASAVVSAAMAAGSPQPMMHADADPLDHLMLSEL